MMMMILAALIIFRVDTKWVSKARVCSAQTVHDCTIPARYILIELPPTLTSQKHKKKVISIANGNISTLYTDPPFYTDPLPTRHLAACEQ